MPPALDPDVVLLQVEAHLLSVLGQDSGRAGVSFLGAERIDVLRFGPDPDGLVRYVTLGMSRVYPFTGIWNYTGQPAAAVPAGFTADGLPLSVQLVGRSNDEATLLSLAAQIEAERPWAERRPASLD